jgi:electron transfer flavoprotein beta subunit
MDTKTLSDLGVEPHATLETLSMQEPAVRKAGIKVDSVEMLVAKPKTAGVV